MRSFLQEAIHNYYERNLLKSFDPLPLSRNFFLKDFNKRNVIQNPNSCLILGSLRGNSITKSPDRLNAPYQFIQSKKIGKNTLWDPLASRMDHPSLWCWPHWMIVLFDDLRRQYFAWAPNANETEVWRSNFLLIYAL